MVCQVCRRVETVDVGVGHCLKTVDRGVGDDLILVRTVDVGVGDGRIDPAWLSTEIPTEGGTKEMRNQPRKQCKPKKICKVSKKCLKAPQSKPANPKNKSKTGKCIKSTSLINSQPATAKGKLNSSKEIVEANSTKEKSRTRFGESENSNEKCEVFPTKTASYTEKSGKSAPFKTETKSSSTPVETGSKSGQRLPTFDEYSSAGESSKDSASDWAQSNSESEDDVDTEEIPKVKRQRKVTPKLAECEICGRTYKTKHLKRHMKTHEEDEDKKKPHRCEKCGKKFTDSNYRNIHQNNCGNDSQLLFQCHICARSLCSKNSLEMHIESHSNERTFQCHLCPKLFKRLDTLNKHINSHSELQPFACDLCERRFKEKRGLLSHKARFHEGKVGAFKCEMCDKVFNHKTSLAEHRDAHLGIKKHTCEVCGKCFGRRNHWQIHLRIHSDTKSFTCSECGKGFNQKYNLTRHMRTHTTGRKLLKCSGTKEANENNRETGNRDPNNEMLSNLVPCGNMMSVGEMYDIIMF